MSATRLRVEVDRFRLHAPFVISNFTWHHAEVCTVHLERDGCVGRGEGVPIAYQPEGARDIARQVEGLRAELEAGLDRKALDERLPAGPARCAVDAALWELEAGLGLGPVHERAGLPAPRTIETAITVVFGSPDEMARQASRFADCPLLKVKLGGSRDAEAIRAVREAAPAARLTVDANTAWTVATLRAMERPLLECGVELVEQPLAPEHDRSVQRGAYPIPLAADESCQSLDDLPRLRDHFDAVVIKLDKSGGLTAALALHAAARQEGLKTMVSCMIGSSLGLAPAALLGARCDWVDLDLPVFLAEDRDPAMTLVQGRLGPAPAGLWGSGQTLRDGAASRP